MCWCGEDRDLAVDGTDAVTHIGQAAARIVLGRRLKTRAGIADFKAQLSRPRVEADRDSGLRAGVLGGVLKSLQAGEVDGALHIRVTAREVLCMQACMRRSPGGSVGTSRSPSGTLGDGNSQGARQPLLPEQRRIGVLDESAQLIECPLCLLGKLIKHVRPSVGLPGEAFGREAEVDAQRDEALLGTVVEIALEPTALFLDGLHGALTRGSELTQRGAMVSLQASIEIGEVASGVIADARKQPLHGAGAESATRETVKPRSWWGRENGGHARSE